MFQIPRDDYQLPHSSSTWLPGIAELASDPGIRSLNSRLEHSTAKFPHSPHKDSNFLANKCKSTEISHAYDILPRQTGIGASDMKQNTSSLAQAVHRLIRAAPTDVQPNLLRRAATKLAEDAGAAPFPLDSHVCDQSWPFDQEQRTAPEQHSRELNLAYRQYMERTTTMSAQNARREAWNTACAWKEAALWKQREFSMERQVNVVESARCVEQTEAHSRRAARQRAAKSEQRWEKAKLAAARRVTLHCATTNIMHMHACCLKASINWSQFLMSSCVGNTRGD